MQYKKLTQLSTLALVVALVVSGCGPESSPMGAVNDDAVAGSSADLGKRGAKKNNDITAATANVAFDANAGDLIAGQHTVVGKVMVTDDGTDITVSYSITDLSWCLTETHVYLSNDTPKKAAPGQFDYGNDALDCVTNWSVTIPIPDGGLPVYIAAHGVAEGSGEGGEGVTTDITASWPEVIDFSVTQPSASGNAYFDVNVQNWGTMSGDYLGWCANPEINIRRGQSYTAYAWSSYDPALPVGTVEFPENLDLVNYLLNQDLIGAGYTYGEIQKAIWELLDSETSDNGLGTWDQNKVDEIVADAEANGEGFLPECGQVYAVILIPFDERSSPSAQPVIITKPVECGGGGEGDETVWAYGYMGGGEDTIYNFFNKNGVQLGWGWWFQYP